MSWLKTQNNDYFYRSIREAGRTKNIYVGRGPIAHVASEIMEQNKSARQAYRVAWQSARTDLEAADELITAYERGCRLLAEAMLLATGHRSYDRHPWEEWKHGRKVIRKAQ